VAEWRLAEWALCPHGYRLEDVPLEGLRGRLEIYLVWYVGQDVNDFVGLHRHGDIAIYLRP